MELAASRLQDPEGDKEMESSSSFTLEPTTIVSCPSCRTRFAVSTSAIAEVEEPRFHCSRCDALFSLSEVTLAPASVGEESVDEVQIEDQLETYEEVSSEDEELVSEEIQNSLSISDFSLSNAPRKELADYEDEPYEEDLLVDNNSLLQEAEISHVVEPLIQNHYSLNLTSPPATPYSPITRSTPTASARSSSDSSSWYGCWFLVSMLLAGLAVLSLISYTSGFNPERVGGLLTSFVPSFLQPVYYTTPPAELVVSKARMDWVELDSGERVPVVYGRLHNGANTTVESVEMEGLAFDSHGEVVAAEHSPAKSALARERISTLTLSTVKRFQGAIAGKHSDMAPGENFDFVVALPSLARADDDTEVRKIRSYSTRVYQVRAR